MTISLFPDYLDIRTEIFLNTELGQLYQALPFKELATPFERYKNQHPQGSKPIFSIEGGLGLQFLKHYLQLSDSKLIARVNTDWQLQMFCGVHIPFTQPVRDEDIVGRWRRFFGLHGDWEAMQEILLLHWKGQMDQTHTRMDDATVFESYIKFPTDVKLLWDVIEWAWEQIQELCKQAGIKMIRWRYDWHKNKQLAYEKRKRKTRKKRRSRCKKLLRALNYLLEKIQELLNRGKEVVELVNGKFFEKLKLAKTIFAQQLYHFENPDKSVPQRIVSFYKPYLRPIVRGKENKRVEFGAKVHMSQVDGINLIEHLSFEAFHEGRRLWRSVYKHRQQFGVLRQYGADQIYASNANRKFLNKQGITSCFKKKGRDAKDTAEQKAQMRSILGKARATLLEGSFGNEKNHYLLDKVKARTQSTEVIWIFFGIHTANAVQIGRRIHASKAKARAA